MEQELLENCLQRCGWDDSFEAVALRRRASCLRDADCWRISLARFNL